MKSLQILSPLFLMSQPCVPGCLPRTFCQLELSWTELHFLERPGLMAIGTILNNQFLEQPISRTTNFFDILPQISPKLKVFSISRDFLQTPLQISLRVEISSPNHWQIPLKFLPPQNYPKSSVSPEISFKPSLQISLRVEISSPNHWQIPLKFLPPKATQSLQNLPRFPSNLLFRFLSESRFSPQIPDQFLWNLFPPKLLHASPSSKLQAPPSSKIQASSSSKL